MAASSHKGVRVAAITGCTASGKTSLCRRLQSAFPSQIFPEIVHADHFFQQGPLLDPPLSSLECWPSGTCPQVFQERKFDTNHPATVNELALVRCVNETIEKASKTINNNNTNNNNNNNTNNNNNNQKIVLVEGFVLLSHPSLLPLLDSVIVLDVCNNEESVNILCKRKYERDYNQRCSYEEFLIYWKRYVYPSFLKYGLPFSHVLSSSLVCKKIDCLLPSEEIFEQTAVYLGLSSSSSSPSSISSSSSSPSSTTATNATTSISSSSSAAASSSSSTSIASSSSSDTKSEQEEIIICISDLHGHISKLRDLWQKLEDTLKDKLKNAKIIFLGDYCDRGPNTKEVLDFLVNLKHTRQPEKTVFLAGNHDFAFGAFLGCLPANVKDGWDLDITTNPHGKEKYWDHKIEGGMQFQGRRWAGPPDIYESVPSFESYGVKNDFTIKSRDLLLMKVPQSHKDFLKDLIWIHDQPLSFAPYRLICVHAGLVTKLPADKQIASLKARTLDDKSLQHIPGRFDALSGRGDVLAMHPDLGEDALLVSGHHGARKFTGNRFVLDLSGGKHYGALEALILTAAGHQVISSKNVD